MKQEEKEEDEIYDEKVEELDLDDTKKKRTRVETEEERETPSKRKKQPLNKAPPTQKIEAKLKELKE